MLYAVRWFICSDRMRDLIQAATQHCQVFPIRLYRSKKVASDNLIAGYSVVQLYEQLECLDPADVLPPLTMVSYPNSIQSKATASYGRLWVIARYFGLHMNIEGLSCHNRFAIGATVLESQVLSGFAGSPWNDRVNSTRNATMVERQNWKLDCQKLTGLAE